MTIIKQLKLILLCLRKIIFEITLEYFVWMNLENLKWPTPRSHHIATLEVGNAHFCVTRWEICIMWQYDWRWGLQYPTKKLIPNFPCCSKVLCTIVHHRDSTSRDIEIQQVIASNCFQKASTIWKKLFDTLLESWMSTYNDPHWAGLWYKLMSI